MNKINTNRGYFGIGVYHPKTEINIGTLWRSAYIYGASFIFTIGRRYKKQASDTLKTYRHVPLWNFKSYGEFKDHIPFDCQLVFIEIDQKSKPLNEFNHPQQAVYVLGAEDYGIPSELMRGFRTVQIPTERDFCLNVSVAGSMVMYDRFIKSLKKE